MYKAFCLYPEIPKNGSFAMQSKAFKSFDEAAQWIAELSCAKAVDFHVKLDASRKFRCAVFIKEVRSPIGFIELN